ncbi:MAG: ferritin family protein [bacterium]|nr:ferritin family protein [bacterium]
MKGTKTEENLKAAFAGESQARNKYTYFAAEARREGYEQIAAIFLETADHEKEHAKRLLKFLNVVGDTRQNLKAAAEGENHEWSIMYKEFAAIAKDEGFHEIATVFIEIGEVEEEHEKRYLKLLENINKNVVFCRETEMEWKCRNCGYIHHGKCAPVMCPACDHPQRFYELHTLPY